MQSRCMYLVAAYAPVLLLAMKQPPHAAASVARWLHVVVQAYFHQEDGVLWVLTAPAGPAVHLPPCSFANESAVHICAQVAQHCGLALREVWEQSEPEAQWQACCQEWHSLLCILP